MKVQISINTDNAAFDEFNGIEIARILHELAEGLDGSDVNNAIYPLYDVNGNKVGRFTCD